MHLASVGSTTSRKAFTSTLVGLPHRRFGIRIGGEPPGIDSNAPSPETKPVTRTIFTANASPSIAPREQDPNLKLGQAPIAIARHHDPARKSPPSVSTLTPTSHRSTRARARTRSALSKSRPRPRQPATPRQTPLRDPRDVLHANSSPSSSASQLFLVPPQRTTHAPFETKLPPPSSACTAQPCGGKSSRSEEHLSQSSSTRTTPARHTSPRTPSQPSKTLSIPANSNTENASETMKIKVRKTANEADADTEPLDHPAGATIHCDLHYMVPTIVPEHRSASPHTPAPRAARRARPPDSTMWPTTPTSARASTQHSRRLRATSTSAPRSKLDDQRTPTHAGTSRAPLDDVHAHQRPSSHPLPHSSRPKKNVKEPIHIKSPIPNRVSIIAVLRACARRTSSLKGTYAGEAMW
ncbi:hypothetical protein B0H16DRAFT_1729056 [Mycena metata]|uniref:Uncharacterized protein n=1 Tax=Mycena metata TaxID=1033252 RepID=A0AAD7ID34_9AGAR|nr:hypothetical protein B0H16DRAFT_1729056 [Mycena metata]